MGMPKMKLAFPILAAVFAADIKQCKEVIKSTGTSAANLVTTISNVPCFTKTPGNNYPQKTCTTNGYSLYFQREGSGTTYFHAEHGCVEDLPKDFPTSDCTTSGTKCDIELTEENFGNYGTIKAEYQFGTAENNLGSITTNNPAVSDVFECYQCEGYEKDNECYKNPAKFKSACDDVNATSCFSTVSSYAGEDAAGKEILYTYAKRGCSSTPSLQATNSERIDFVGQVPQDTTATPLVYVNREIQTTLCATKNCNKATMDFISYSSVHQLTASISALILSLFMR